LVRQHENPMNNVFLEMIIVKYNVHVTMLFDGMVRRKSHNLICFMVGIVIEYYCRVDHNIFVLLCNNVGTLVNILNKTPDVL